MHAKYFLEVDSLECRHLEPINEENFNYRRYFFRHYFVIISMGLYTFFRFSHLFFPLFNSHAQLFAKRKSDQTKSLSERLG